jgi:hypothetical protein
MFWRPGRKAQLAENCKRLAALMNILEVCSRVAEIDVLTSSRRFEHLNVPPAFAPAVQPAGTEMPRGCQVAPPVGDRFRLGLNKKPSRYISL